MAQNNCYNEDETDPHPAKWTASRETRLPKKGQTMSRTVPILRLSEMLPDQEGDFFALLSSKEEMTTRDKTAVLPTVGFRDADREVSFPIWANSPWAAVCREEWTPGEFYKLRAVLSRDPIWAAT